MQTLLDNAKTDRPERRTALVVKELAHYKVDIAPLSETHLPDKGQLIECGCGYTFFGVNAVMKNRENQVLDLQLSLRLCENLQTCQRESHTD